MRAAVWLNQMPVANGRAVQLTVASALVLNGSCDLPACTNTRPVSLSRSASRSLSRHVRTHAANAHLDHRLDQRVMVAPREIRLRNEQCCDAVRRTPQRV